MSEIPPPTAPSSAPGGSYTPPPPPPAGTAPGSDRTIFLVLSYLGILCLIPLFVKKDDAEVQWHAKNGTVLFLAEIAWVIVRIAVAYAGISCAMSIVCIVKAVGGQRFRIPVLTDLAEKM